MPRTSIPITTTAFQGGQAISYTAADATNNMMFTNAGDTVLIVKNASASPVTVTVQAVPDEAGREVDLAQAVAAGAEALLGPFRSSWWSQKSGTDIGKVYVDFSVATSVSVAALKINK